MFSGVPPWIAASRSAGGAPGSTIAQIVNASVKQAGYWDFNDNSKMAQLYTDPPGNVADGNSVGLVDATAGALNLQEQASISRPVWQANAGNGRLFFDGGSKGLMIYGVTGGLSSNTSVFAVWQRNAGTKFQMVQRQGVAHYFWQANQNDTTNNHFTGFGGAMSFRRNGAAYTPTKAGDVFTDCGTGKVLLTAQNVNFNGYASGVIEFADSGYSGYDANGWIHDIVVIPDLSDPDRGVIEAELAAKHSITLP